MKKFYLIIISCFLLLLLAACSDDSKETSGKKGTDKPDTEQKEKDPVVEKYSTVTPVDELEDRDYGGLTFTWAGPVLRDIDPEESEVKELWYNRIKELEEKWNFKFESKTLSGDGFIGNYIRTTLAGDPVGDVVYLNTPAFFPNLPENGIAYPISDLDVIDLDDPKWVQSARKASEYKGKTYSVRPGTAETVAPRDGIFWNKTLFENLGLPDLYELYENGEWTWDKMMEIADLATRDVDNDGTTDIYGLLGFYLPWDFIYSNGGEAVIQTNEGIDVNLNDPNITEALEYYQTVYKDYNHVFPGEDSEGISFENGNLAMYVYEWWIADWSFAHGKMEDNYGYLPFPSGPSNEDPENPVTFGMTESLEIMLATVDKPKEKLEIWDEITNIGTADDWERWTRESYEAGADDAESVEFAELLEQNIKTNLIYGFADLSTIVTELFEDIKTGGTTVQSGLEAIDPQIEAALAEFKENGVDLGITEEEIEETKKSIEDGTYDDGEVKPEEDEEEEEEE